MNSKLQQISAVIALTLFKGKKTFDENGNINSEHQSLKIEYGTKQYQHTLTHLLRFGFTEAKVISIDGNTEHEAIAEVQNEFNKLFKPTVIIDPKDSKIQELSGQIEELRKMVEGSMSKELVNTGEDLEKLRDEYTQLVGERPHHKMGADKLKEAIIEAKKK